MGWLGMNILLRSGQSWSGGERHCVFLNTGGDRFANVSALTGIDFKDDGRTVAEVDWDRDGDLDLWIGGRTGPRVRFLRNDAPKQRFLLVHLEGRSGNRDAIGARVTLSLGSANGSGPKRHIRTVRGGGGFMTQSSRWLHFGLGEHEAIEGLTVRWPDGELETFPGLEVDHRYRLVEGSGEATEVAAPAKPIRLEASELEAESVSSQTHIFVPTNRPIFTERQGAKGKPLDLTYQGFSEDGQAGDPVAFPEGKLVLLNLWASWCAPCVKELKELSGAAGELEAAGLTVLALAGDGLVASQDTDAQDAFEMAKRLDLPFTVGMATPEILEQMATLQSDLMWNSQLAVPTSLLIGERGGVVALYRGPVTLEQLRRDLQLMQEDPAARRDRSLPFSGRWLSDAPR